jgi:DNA-3-methyladenine glycosylase I
MKNNNKLIRCDWCTEDQEYIDYHDNEWGVPLHDDRALFELLILEGAQAGLSWLTVLKKRSNYRTAFNNFQLKQVLKFDENKIQELITNPGIIRNKLKIRSVFTNAKVVEEIQKQYGSFNKYLWEYVNNKTLDMDQTNSRFSEANEISINMSKNLKRLGMSFVGPTICYAFMQSSGLINDHEHKCFRYKQLTNI